MDGLQKTGPVLLIVIGFICLFSWLTISQPSSPARIKVECEGTDIAILSDQALASNLSYDPYFIHVNDFRQILIPASKGK